MNLLDIERLIHRLAGVLKGSVDASLAPKLADDHAAVCKAVSLRLHQCEAMIQVRDFAQAVQLAETPPNLLDCITLLEFQEVDDWRAYCRSNQLPCPEPFDPKSVRGLNECYAQGIKTDDPLYKRYRKAVLTKNDPEALAVLRSIVRLNPADQNAAAELSRLDRKVLNERLLKLQGAIEARDAPKVLEQIQEIESGGFQSSPAGDVWSKAQAIRALELLRFAEAERQHSRWRDALLTLDFIRNLQSDFHFILPPDAQGRFAAVESWARTEEQRDKRDNEFKSLLAELHYRVETSEEKDTVARPVALKELKEDFEGMQRVWRALEQFTRPIPEEADTRFRKRSKLLQMEIRRRTGRRLMMMGASVVAVLLAGGWVTWFFLGQIRAREFASQLGQAVGNRQVVTAEKVLQSVRDQQPRLLAYGSMNLAVAAAESFISNERTKLQAYAVAFGKLPAGWPSKLAGEQLVAIQRQFTEATNLLAQLAPDLKETKAAQLLAFQNKWEACLSEQTSAVNLGFERALLHAEQLGPRLDYTQSPDRIRERLTDFVEIQARLNEYEAGFRGIIPLRDEFIKRSGVVQARVASYRQELEKLDRHVQQVRGAQTFDAFTTGLKGLARSEFRGAPEVNAAMQVESLKCAPDAVLVALLFPDAPALLGELRSAASFAFMPKAVMPAERDKYLDLVNDKAVTAEHLRYRLVIDRRKNTTSEWISLAPLKKAHGWQSVLAYRVEASPARYLAQPAEYGLFDGKFRLSPTQSIEEVQDLGLCTETAPFAQVKLAQLLADDRATYRFPLLRTMEELKSLKDGSPLFRAFLTLRLIELMELEPELWGLPFAPALRSYRQALQQAGASQLVSGDWFAPERVQQLAAPLESAFLAARRLSLWDQAQGHARLCKQVVDSGLSFAGFTGLDGAPQFVREPKGDECIGYSATAKTPVVLFKRQDRKWRALEAPLPFAPLFLLKESRSEMLRTAEVDVQRPEFARSLPPLFANRGEPNDRPLP